MLLNLSDSQALDPVVLGGLIRSTDRIGSDHEKARVLLDVVERQKLEGELRNDCVEAARTIGSDHERGRVMDALQESGL